MRRLLTLATLAILACGGPTGPEPEPEPTGTPSLAIVSGDNQTVQVTDTLPFDAEVCATRGGEPVVDQLMDWKVLEDGAGEPFVTTTQTGPDGCTGNRIVAGTRAHTHPELDGPAHVEVRWIKQDSILAITEDPITYIVEPGEPVEMGWSVDDRSPIRRPPGAAVDQYGNPAPGWRFVNVSAPVHIPSDAFGSDSARTVVADSIGEGVVCMEHETHGMFTAVGVTVDDRTIGRLYIVLRAGEAPLSSCGG